MRYTIDHDFHIHSFLSICSDDEGQVPSAILENAIERNLKIICITDHYWDERVPCNTAVNWWYEKQNHAHISTYLPLPKLENVQFLFGCEADMDSDNVIGLSKSRYNEFDFIIVSTTHFHHMAGPQWTSLSNKDVANRWVERFDAVLNAELPFGKVGIAHLACSLINLKSHEDYLENLNLIPQKELERLFTEAAKKGLGIELNFGDMSFKDDEKDTILRIFKTAKNCGCKFYLGSDAHSRADMEIVFPVFERAIDLLGLKECDKFIIK